MRHSRHILSSFPVNLRVPSLISTNTCVWDDTFFLYGRYRRTHNGALGDFSFVRHFLFSSLRDFRDSGKCARRDLWASALTAPDTLFLYRVGKRFTVRRLTHCRVKERGLSIYYASMKCGFLDERAHRKRHDETSTKTNYYMEHKLNFNKAVKKLMENTLPNFYI